jgi:DNA polymerase I
MQAAVSRSGTMNLNDVPFDYFNDDRSAEAALTTLFQEKVLGLDTETTALDPMRGELRLVQFATEEQAYVFDIRYLNNRIRSMIATLMTREHPIKIIHNAKFDLKFTYRKLGVTLFGTIFDTMLAAMVVSQAHFSCDAIFSNSFSLEGLAFEYANVSLEKKDELQKSDWSLDVLDDDQLKYAARDALILHPIRKALIERIKEYRLIDAAKLEFEAVECVAQVELNGFRLNMLRWLEQYDRMVIKRDELMHELWTLLAPGGIPQQMLFDGAPTKQPINLNSIPQIIGALERVGVELPLVDGKPSTRAHKLKGIAYKYPIVSKVITYREHEKACTSYGPNWGRYIDKLDGRIHASCRQIGADTSRMAFSDPNLQQPPKEDAYRMCFEAADGNTLVWADYSLMELRIAAYLSGDELLIEAFKSGRDFHKYTASMIFNVPYEEVTPEQRNPSKNMNYLVVYGGGPHKLAETMGISLDHAQSIIDMYMNKFIKLRDWLEAAGASAIRDRLAMTVSGRRFKFQFNQSDKKVAAAIGRKGKNTPIQGSSCDILKRSLRFLWLDVHDKTQIKVIHLNHDEIVLEVAKKFTAKAKTILKRAMMKAWDEMIPTVPMTLDVHSGMRWHK